MNEKGFTLIELIAVLALIVISSTMIIVNLQGISDKQTSKISERSIKEVENAACLELDSLNFSERVQNYFDSQKYGDLVTFYSAFFKIGDDYLTRKLCMSRQGCVIPLKFLVQEGIIDEDDEVDSEGTTYRDLSTGTTNIWLIQITWEDNQKVCTCKKFSGTITSTTKLTEIMDAIKGEENNC